ncbi:PKD domain-containing protein [Aquimarina pacifica]|uniref:PKD domain-containing protein n=1 Tax=Aquimarina pacifica TaxID=1296415 RepID=UPI0004719A86|nr:PKD domain-containing protein [Aquimarina pacifica]
MKSQHTQNKTLRGFIKGLNVKLLYAIAITVSIGLGINAVSLFFDGTAGPEMTTQTWPAGTFLANFPEGDRINTYHRNHLMISGQEGTGIWDISNPTAPTKLQSNAAANNGHRWWKMGDLYYREYSVPEVAGTGYKYLDLSDMLNRVPITSSDVLFTVEDGQSHYDNLETFPHTVDGNRVYDMRTGEFMSEIQDAVTLPDIVVRMGNYVFYAPQSGEITVYDFGDAENIKYLGSFGGDVPHEQYSTGFQVWRNYLVYMSGNEGDNLVAFDISDPTNVTHAFNIHSDDITLGRYMTFQDEYGFTGRFDRGVKYNFETMEVEQEFLPPSDDESLQFLDNQWLPIGHILVASGDGKTSIFSHQDELDTNPPYVGHHFPVAGATNQPIGTTIGFVINEVIDDLSVTDETIQVRPLGGEPIVGDVTSTSYQVTNYAPREPLLPNTTYEVKFVEGGIKDAVGNGMEEYVFYFTTGGDDSNQSPEVSGIDTSIPSPMLIGSTIDFTANATDAEGNSLTYRWDFGDSSAKTDWIGNTTSYTYDEPGNYLVQVQVSDNNGGFSVASQAITVVASLPENLPTQSSPIAVDTEERVVWSVNPDNNTVTMINADDLSVIREVAVGEDPVSIAIDESNRAWVSCRDADAIYVVDQNGTIDEVISLSSGARPYGVVFTPDRNRVFVSAFGSGEILEISPSTHTVINTLAIGETPRALAVSGDGMTLLITRFISEDTEGQVWQVDLSNFSIGNTIDLALDDFTSDNGNAGRGLPNYIAGVTIHPDNTTAWSVAKKDNIVRGLSRDGQPLTFDNAVRTALSPINLTTSSEELSKRLDIDNHGQPSSALYTPTGNYLFVTMQGNNEIVVIDPETGLELLTKNVGKAPQGLAIDTQTNRVFVKNFMDRTVSVFDGQDMITTGANILDEVTTLSTVSSETLSATVLKGKQIFYDASDIRMGTDGYVSCATCHIDGTQDGRTWDFTDRGEGLRNTISLIGRAGTAHGRVHWSANFDEIQDFENDMRSHFQGTGFMSDGDFNEGTTALTLGDTKAGKSVDLDALTAYIESLNSFDPSPYRNDNGTLTTAAVAGKSLFEDLQCTSCHGGENFTDSNTGRLHDVGTMNTDSGNRLGKTLIGLDVPTLRDAWATAPYLHNGAAATIMDVLTTYNSNDAHGATSTLSTTELSQLEAYIKQIDGTEPALSEDLVVTMATPSNADVIEKADPILLSVDTNIDDIVKIEYYVDQELVEEVTTSPFEAFWSPIIWKTYAITAKVYYNNGNTASVTPEINVSYKNDIKVMFVVGDDDELTSEDQTIKSRLEQKLGFTITLFADEDAERPEDANPYDLVLISSSVDPGVLGNDLESAVVPMMTWDPYMYEKIRLTTGSITSDFGFTEEAYTTATITNPDHPMAAEVGAEVSLYSVTVPLPFGTPSEDAVVIARAGDDAIAYGYEAEGTMPSRRVAFPLRDQFMHLLTDDGWAMFDAAIVWTLHGGDADTPVAPLADIFFTKPLDGALVNTPLAVDFDTEGWSLPSSQYKLRFRIDGQDRGFISSEGEFIDGTALSEGPHELTLEMERSNNSLTALSDTITVIVTNDPLPENPTAIINSPIDGGLVAPDFQVEFSTYLWDISPGGQHVRYFIDGQEMGSVYEITPIVLEDIADGEHTIELVLAEADGTLTDYTSSITVTVDSAFENLPDTDFSLEYRNNGQAGNSVELKPVFQIVSDAEEAIPYSDFTIRYWYTPEHEVDMNFNVDYTAVSGVTGTFGSVDDQDYIEIGFSASSGNLSANGESGEIQTRINHLGFQAHDQSNDFSFDSGKTSLKPHVLVTLYYQGELVWGLEPIDDGGNSRPNASFVSDLTVGEVPMAVNFDASGSTDSDGDTLTYSWDFGTGDTASGVTTSYTFTEVGIYVVTLTVSDGNGGTDTQVRTITIIEAVELEAAISASVIQGTVPLNVDFDSSSSVIPENTDVAYTWDFGDGNTSTVPNPSHIFTEVGIYQVMLTLTDGVDSSSSIIEINVLEEVNQDPVAALSTSVTSGAVPVLVTFDASLSIDPDGDTLTYFWDFGNGDTATGVTTTYEFTEVGTQLVTLTVNDGNGNTDSEIVTIDVYDALPPLAASFDVSVTTGTAPLSVAFDSSSSVIPDGSDVTYSWDFGDGTTSTLANPTHIFTEAASYAVTLTLSDGTNSSISSIVTITVEEEEINLAPLAILTSSSTSGEAPFAIDFDSSESSDPNGDALVYTWDFGDGTTGGGSSVSHTFGAGTFQVVLTVSDGSLFDTASIEIFVTEPLPEVTAVIAADTNIGIAPATINFDGTDSTSEQGEIIEYLWDFGDDTMGTGSVIAHEYTEAGTYIVTLTVTNEYQSSDIATETIIITSDDDTSCNFGTPLSEPLATIPNASYSNSHVLGTGGPDLSNVTSFVINWDLQNNGLWQMSFNTNNGIPGWWINLTTAITSQNFNSVAPQVTLSGTGIPNFDGEYYVTIDGGNFVMVSINSSFTIYFSNSADLPTCSNVSQKSEFKTSEVLATVYPIPSNSMFTMQLVSPDVTGIKVYSVTGQELLVLEPDALKNRTITFGENFATGNYFAKVFKDGGFQMIRLLKR